MFKEFLLRLLVVAVSILIVLAMVIVFSFLPDWMSWIPLVLWVLVFLGWPFIKGLVKRGE